MNFFYNFILDIPYLFLKKIPYAWVLVIALWAWPPVISGIFTGIIVLGMTIMVLQQYAWEAKVKSEYRVLYRNRPRAPLWYRVRNFLLTCLGSIFFGWFLGRQFGLTPIQWGLMFAGIMFLYKDALLFGAHVVYLVTNKGIAIHFIPGHVDYRLFFGFDEIHSIEYIRSVESVSPKWSLLVPRRKITQGLLLKPLKLDGFSKQIEEVFLCPTDIESFIKCFPPSVVVKEHSRPLRRPQPSSEY